MGSPPPTRGTLAKVVRSIGFFRITPAYAGNTYAFGKLVWLNEDHPRLRGEHNGLSLQTQVVVGSPPPTRGTLCIHLRSTLSLGITPAYAGNTPPVASLGSHLQDHPRLRGEHFLCHLQYVLP